MIDAVWILVRAIAILLICSSLISNSATPVLQSQTQAAPKEIWIGDILTRDDRVRYNGYVLEKRKRKVRYDYPRQAQASSARIDVSYAVLKRKGKTVARFDDNIYFGMGNDVRFGLISILGGPTKQVVISQDIPRGGTQWVMNLSPRPRLIFDGSKWGAGREGDDMRIVDLDNDGVYEITVPLTFLYGFSGWVPTGRTPLPTAIFKYDRKAQEYVPASPEFQDYLLESIDKRKRAVSPPEDKVNHITDILPIVVDYIFAGKEMEAWTFFDETYKLSDKNELKAKISAAVRRQPVYRFIYRKHSKSRN